jgi:hypothetical protein
MIQTYAFKAMRLCMILWLKIRMYCNCCRERPGTKVFREETEGIQLDMFRIVRLRESGQIDVKYRLSWPGKENNTDSVDIFDHVMPPWLMITKDGDDFTEQLYPYVAKGNWVTTRFLEWKFGPGKWKILDPRTFDEVDFPSGGITIK